MENLAQALQSFMRNMLQSSACKLSVANLGSLRGKTDHASVPTNVPRAHRNPARHGCWRLLIGLSLLPASLAANARESSVETTGRRIQPFSLRDCRGTIHSLDEFKDSPLLVVAFLGTECPLAKLYAPRLASLQREFSARGVAFLGINSNKQDSNTEILHYIRIHEIPFPILKDLDQAVADQFAAVRTPEVFLLDQDRVIRYRGRIDDQYGIGYQRPAPTSRDLASAIEELLSHRPIRVPVTEAPGCFIGRAKPVRADGAVTWTKQISRIFQKHCQECHRPGQIAPFPLLEASDARGWGDTIQEVIEQNRMPPWHANPDHGNFANDARLDQEEKDQVFQWIADGMPEGNPADLPPPRPFVEGWQIPKPDQVVYMTPQPVSIPAEGVVEYQWYLADPGFTEDKWVKAVECRPGNRSVVHHVTVYFRPPGGVDLKINDRINLLGGFAPGKAAVDVPGWDGTARFVPKGSKFLFEMHYTPNGSPQTDRSAIALVFADPKEVKRQLSIVLVANNTFAIPPRADNYVVESSYTFDEDSLIHSLSPHMHLRGKKFRFEAFYPNGNREILLDVPNFDFNWQFDYMLAKPKEMPVGTRIHCTASFDNSEENLANPDPNQEVRWGDQTWEEMMIGAIGITPLHQDIARGVGKPIQVLEGKDRTFAVLTAGGLLAVAAGLLWYRRRVAKRGA
ncbi:MAG: redoxin domain-containing protein [Planctomycetota bacterium]